MTPPGTFDRVYAELKDRLRSGFYRPGTRLEPAALSDELHASVTPVRDALHRLTGERLVEAPRHEGFRAPALSEPVLRQLYAWHHDLLTLAALRRRPTRGQDSTAPLDPASPPGRASDLFRNMGQESGNPELAATLDGLLDRMEPVEQLASRFLDATDDETQQIARAVEMGDRRALRGALLRYHRRRDRIVPALLAGLLLDQS